MEFLARAFFERAPDDVARDLIGVRMTVRQPSAVMMVRIVETEAYGAADDAASHAFRGRSPRNRAMFGPAGHLYVYRSYGLHWCMNVVTQGPDIASAVLLRGAELLADEMADADSPAPSTNLRGPGNLTAALGVTSADDGRDCCDPQARITFAMTIEIPGDSIGRSTRIGISRARDRLSRYYLEGSPAVSKTLRASPP
jgi:DNA-3-methyladenine glycosylase